MAKPKINKRDKKLEEFWQKEYKKQALLAAKKADIHIAAANAELKKATEIAEEFGVALASSISPIYQSYIPNSLKNKWTEEQIQFFRDSYLISEFGYGGWEHSDVC